MYYCISLLFICIIIICYLDICIGIYYNINDVNTTSHTMLLSDMKYYTFSVIWKYITYVHYCTPLLFICIIIIYYLDICIGINYNINNVNTTSHTMLLSDMKIFIFSLTWKYITYVHYCISLLFICIIRIYYLDICIGINYNINTVNTSSHTMLLIDLKIFIF